MELFPDSGFTKHKAADQFCREYDDLRNIFRSRYRHNQYLSATRRRRHFLQGAQIGMGIARRIAMYQNHLKD